MKKINSGSSEKQVFQTLGKEKSCRGDNHPVNYLPFLCCLLHIVYCIGAEIKIYDIMIYKIIYKVDMLQTNWDHRFMPVYIVP